MVLIFCKQSKELSDTYKSRTTSDIFPKIAECHTLRFFLFCML